MFVPMFFEQSPTAFLKDIIFGKEKKNSQEDFSQLFTWIELLNE